MLEQIHVFIEFIGVVIEVYGVAVIADRRGVRDFSICLECDPI